jgi:hypothetical protein
MKSHGKELNSLVNNEIELGMVECSRTSPRGGGVNRRCIKNFYLRDKLGGIKLQVFTSLAQGLTTRGLPKCSNKLC